MGHSSHLSRRRRRSVRVSVSTALMAAATSLVLAALAVSSRLLLSLVALAAVACGWAALRIVRTELVQSRHRHARERASQARAFRSLLVQRSAEQAVFASTMADRLSERDRTIRELEGVLRLSERRAEHAEARLRRAATWDSSGQADLDTVVDLLAWEDRFSANRTAEGASAAGQGA